MLILHLMSLLLVALQPSVKAPQAPPPPKANPPYTSNNVQKIDINLPALKFFCDGRQSDLKRYIEASPHWRLGIERQGDKDFTIAYRRSGPRVTLNGFIGSSTQTRV